MSQGKSIKADELGVSQVARRKSGIFAAINVYYAATEAARPSDQPSFREEVWLLLSSSPYHGIEVDAERVVRLLNLRAMVQPLVEEAPLDGSEGLR